MTAQDIANKAEMFLAGEVSYEAFMREAVEVWDSFREKNKPAWDLIFEIEHQPVLHDGSGKITSAGKEWLNEVGDLIAKIKRVDSQ